MIGHAKLAGVLLIVLALSGSRAHASTPAQPAYSAASLYNSGNSYARAGKPGLAVLYYERARLLAPSDPDIQANLRAVREKWHLPDEPSSLAQRAVLIFDPARLAWAEVMGLLLAGTAVIAGRVSSRHRGLRWTALCLGVAPLLLTACQAVILWPLLHEAVVVTDAAPARVSPVPLGDQLFTLREAETVRMTAEHEGYILIRTRTGREGWVSRASVAPVLPR